MRDLHVIDVSATLHGGIKGHFGDNNSHGFPTGGIFNTLKILNKKTIDVKQDVFVFCFDRRTRVTENEEGEKVGYKEGRARWDVGMYYQAKLFEEMLIKMGFNVVYQEDREADECIDAVVRKYVGQARHVYIYGTDRDLASLVSPKSTLVSTNSNVSDVTYENYSYAIAGVCGGEHVPYNAILLYKIFRVDKSDNIKAVVSADEWEKLVIDLKNANFPLRQLNTRAGIEFVIKNYKCEDEVRQLLWESYELVIPRETCGDISLEREYNLDVMEQYCSLLSLSQFPKKFGVQISGVIKRDWYDRLVYLAQEVNEELVASGKSVPKPFANKKFVISEEYSEYSFFESYKG